MNRFSFKKEIAAILILLTICSTMGSCSKEPKINRKISPMATSGMITYGLYGMNGEIENESHFEIDSNEVFEKYFSFGNMIEVERTYKLLVFANYNQIDFSVDDAKQNSCYDFTAKPNEHLDFKISIPDLEDGFYDLLFVIVKDPNNLSLDEEYRKQTDLSHLTVIRYSLKKGSDAPGVEAPAISMLNTEDDSALSGVFLNQNASRLQRLLTVECCSGEKNEMYVHIGNQTEEDHEYLVILLSDWNQIKFDAQNLIYCSVPSKSRSVLPFEISYTENGIHNIAAICVQDPFQYVTKDTPRPDFSIRVGIDVR